LIEQYAERAIASHPVAVLVEYPFFKESQAAWMWQTIGEEH